jgi:hypothetical protein
VNAAAPGCVEVLETVLAAVEVDVDSAAVVAKVEFEKPVGIVVIPLVGVVVTAVDCDWVA